MQAGQEVGRWSGPHALPDVLPKRGHEGIWDGFQRPFAIGRGVALPRLEDDAALAGTCRHPHIDSSVREAACDKHVSPLNGDLNARGGLPRQGDGAIELAGTSLISQGLHTVELRGRTSWVGNR